MSVNHGAEVEGKVHRLCQEFGNIHRGTVKQIFLLVRIGFTSPDLRYVEYIYIYVCTTQSNVTEFPCVSF